METQTQSAGDTFRELRDLALHGNAIRSLEVDSSVDDGAVLGVAMELCVDSGHAFILGLNDGTASVYLSSGGGFIGGHEHAEARAAAQHFVETSQPFAERFPRTEDFPLPKTGEVHFLFLTPDSVRVAVGDEAELTEERGELLPLFLAGHSIVACYGQITERSEDPSEYLNCLLTALARGHARSAILRNDQAAPDPATMTDDTEDQEWIRDMRFQLESLASPSITLVLEMMTFRWWDFGRKRGRIRAVLIGKDGHSRSDVEFEVLRRGQGAEIEISPLSG